MNAKFIFLVVLSCFSLLSSIYAQSMDEAFVQAKKEKKIVMVAVESASCKECNDVAAKGISTNLVKSAISNNAIFLKVSKMPEAFLGPSVLYILPSEFFGVLFLDADRNMLDIMEGSSSSYIPYLDHIDKAVKENQSNGTSLADLKKNYYNNIGSFESIIQLIEKIRKLNLEPQQQLLDELTQKAPEDSANSLSFLQFIAHCAPVINSIAEQYLVKNRDTYNMAWYRMSLQERIILNNRIYVKSLSKAIRDKDTNFAYRVSSNRSNNFNTGTAANMEEGQKASAETMLQFYKGINDTISYLRSVFTFYDRFYMNTKVEIILKEDSIRKDNLFKKVPTNSTTGTVMPSSGVAVKTVSFAPRAGFYAGQLNNGAWTVYTYTKDKNHLAKAVTWVKRGLEFAESPALMDTYARLLYKTGNKEEAISWEQKAIEGNKKKEMPAGEFEKVLELMKAGVEKIDAY